MEIKVGLKYTCRNNGPDWHGKITSIGTSIVQVDFYEDNLRTGSGSDPIEKVINYFETGYFKIKEDFKLPEQWYIQGYNDDDITSLSERQKLIEWKYFNDNFGLDFTFSKNYYYCYDGTWWLAGLYDLDYTKITIEEFRKYVLNSNNSIKLTNMLKYINERNRTLT